MSQRTYRITIAAPESGEEQKRVLPENFISRFIEAWRNSEQGELTQRTTGEWGQVVFNVATRHHDIYNLTPIVNHLAHQIQPDVIVAVTNITPMTPQIVSPPMG